MPRLFICRHCTHWIALCTADSKVFLLIFDQWNQERSQEGAVPPIEMLFQIFRLNFS